MLKIRDFFYLNKSDRMGVLFMLVLGFACAAAFFLAGNSNTKVELSASDSLAMAMLHDTVYRYGGGHPTTTYRDAGNGHRPARFAFDPNTADSTQLLRLGLKPWQVRGIYRYRASGGIFRRPEDFAKVYGLTRGQFEELRPYIQIGDYYQDARSYYTSSTPERYHRDTVLFPVKMVPGETLSLNASDTAALKHVPGIGSGFARRIVRYRQQLGGFVRVDQLKEINGFPESALVYFRLDSVPVRKLHVNKYTVSQLHAHPYINFYQARAIADYRRLHGPLRHIRDLRLLKEFTANDIQRLEPYLQY